MSTSRFSVTVLLVLAVNALPAAASADIDITWGNCAGETQQQTAVLDCSQLGSASLYVSFKSPVPFPEFYEAEAILLIRQVNSSSVLDPFWHGESGGCNESGFTVSCVPQLPTCASEVSPWGFGGAESQVSHGMIVEFPSPGDAELVVDVARNTASPFPLSAGTEYYMCHIIINRANVDNAQDARTS